MQGDGRSAGPRAGSDDAPTEELPAVPAPRSLDGVGPEGVTQPAAERAIALAYRALSSRERTVAELRTFLERKRCEPSVIDAAVDELSSAGFLDDARYALRFAEDKRSLERWGSERIARELHRRGVSAELIDAALATQPRKGELRAALELLAERFPARPEDDRSRDRAWRLLVRKGYEPELAYEAVREHGRTGGRNAA